MATITKFDASAHLDSDETIADYPTVVLEQRDPGLFLVALGDVAAVARRNCRTNG